MIPKPALIVLDAFGTLFTPKGSAFKQYSEFAAQYNIIVTPDDVEQRFKSGMLA
jgi:FMN phosphatase YigB (HAD superfamily)